jgi:hypothetical protein
MPPRADALCEYIEHLKARDRLPLPADIAVLCTTKPSECLDLIIRALQQPIGPGLVAAIGNELLENLLNESSALISDEVAGHLRTNKRFRQAFSFGNYSSVDPAIISDWVRVFQELGTTKAAERKSLYSRAMA